MADSRFNTVAASFLCTLATVTHVVASCSVRARGSPTTRAKLIGVDTAIREVNFKNYNLNVNANANANANVNVNVNVNFKLKSV